nr:DNA primase [uncultured Arsenicibacter sp.]
MSTQIQNPDPGSTISTYDETSLELLDINKAVAETYHRHLKELLADPEHPVTRYVRSAARELSDEQIDSWLLGYAPDEWRFITTPLIEQGAFSPAVAAGVCVENGTKKYDFFRNRLMIPLFDENGNVAGFTGRAIDSQEPKYLNTRETPVFQKSGLLFGLNRARRTIIREKHVVLTEGNFDVTTLHRYGLTETVGKGGTALTDAQISKISGLAESVTLIYDVDPNGSGQKALISDCERLLEAGLRVKVFHLPVPEDGSKTDADAWGRMFMRQQEKTARMALARHVAKHAEDGLLWLAGVYAREPDMNLLVEKENRLLSMLLKLADEELRSKLVRKLAAVLESEPRELTRRLKKLRTGQERLPAEAAAAGTEDMQTDTVWYRQHDMTMRVKGGRGGWNTVANNFHLYIKYQTEDEDENLTWILEIRTQEGEPIFIEVPHDDFTSASRLRKIITGKRYSLKASDNELSELQAFLFSETGFARAIKITRYGYHPESGVFFFANKAVNGRVLEPDQFGMVTTEKQNRQLVLSMPAQNKNKAHRFTLTDTRLSINEFFGLYSAAHLYDNAIIPFCFLLMSLYRDVALRHKKFTPILFVKGSYGTGKSSLVRVLTAAFGMKQEGVNLGSKNTEAALVKMMSQASNCFIWMDEYHNELGTIEKLLQAMYDNDGYHRSKDNTSVDTEAVSIYQSLALTSNFLPRTEVFFSRCVFIPVNSQEKTAQQKLAFDRLEEFQESGLGCLTLEALQHRSLIEKEYPAAWERLHHALKQELASEKIPERFFANMAQILTAGFILAAAGKISLTEEQQPEAVLAELVRVGTDNIRRQYRIMSEKAQLATFFETIQTLYDQYQIHEEVHFDFEMFEGKRMIRLWLPQLYTLYAERYRRATSEKPADRDTIQTELAILMDYPDWESLKKSIRFRSDGEGTRQESTQVRHNCCRVSYELLQRKYGLNLEQRKQKNNGFTPVFGELKG